MLTGCALLVTVSALLVLLGPIEARVSPPLELSTWRAQTMLLWLCRKGATRPHV